MSCCSGPKGLSSSLRCGNVVVLGGAIQNVGGAIQTVGGAFQAVDGALQHTPMVDIRARRSTDIVRLHFALWYLRALADEIEHQCVA